MQAGMSNNASRNVNPAELEKFAQMAARWWDVDGPSRPLHDLNPARLAYVQERRPLAGARVLDVGCGGGLLSEALALAGADTLGIDLTDALLEVASLHRHEQTFPAGAKLEYRNVAVEELAREQPGSFDAITCMEMLEHVPDPESVIVACATLLKPGGNLFLSTLNRTPKAFALAILGAEYALRLLPRGTHEYAKFIRPAEMARALREAGLELMDVSGLHYEPFTRRVRRGGDTQVNYLAWARRPA
jgi:2-polyprenyl-6-hydroxyphenyl methylase/3-demethylubiquinone-9 3-methyltransferase